MMTIVIVAIVSLFAGVLFGTFTLCILMSGRRDEEVEDLNHRLQLWRNAFSSDTAEKAIYWINLLHKAGEVRNIDEEGDIDSQTMGRGSPDLHDAYPEYNRER